LKKRDFCITLISYSAQSSSSPLLLNYEKLIIQESRRHPFSVPLVCCGQLDFSTISLSSFCHMNQFSEVFCIVDYADWVKSPKISINTFSFRFVIRIR